MTIVKINPELRSAKRVCESIGEMEPEKVVVIVQEKGVAEVYFSECNRLEAMGMLQAAIMELWTCDE